MKLNLLLATLLTTSTLMTACSSKSTSTSATNLSAEARCAAYADLSSEQFDLDISSATYVKSVDAIDAQKNRLSPEQLSEFKPYCQLSGYFEKRLGADNKPYSIGFGLSLPDDWNGKFLFQGGGGLNGLIRDPFGSIAAGNMPALFRGFAVASTDGGHQSNTVFDPTFFADQQALLNFYSGAVEKSTYVALEILNTVYQQTPEQNYFVGCSTGGREAMTMSQRFPDLFDGIIVGAPARQTNYSEVADLWSAKRLRQASSDPTKTPFSASQQQAIIDEVLKQCDANDGLADGLVFDVEGCDFKAQALLCKNNDSAGRCLNQAGVAALQEAFAGPKTNSGEQVYPGFYFDTGIIASGQRSIPGLLQAVPGPLGAQFINEPFNIEKQVALAKHFPLAGGNAVLTNLSSFAQHGGKLLFFHGVSDPWFSAKDTLQYYQAMSDANGGIEQSQHWSQFYFVPGMGHCGGGEQTLDNFDMLSSLVEWVEHDQPPSQVIATGQSMPDISRPLCPYPKVAFYTGNGNTQQASEFECKVPSE